MGKITTIRNNLTLNFLVIIVLLSSAILITMAFASRSAIKSLSDKIINQAIDQTERKIVTYFDPVSTGLVRMKTLAEIGMLDLSRPEKLRNQFETIIQHFPQISSIILADEYGRECMLQKRSAGWMFRNTDPNHNTQITEYDEQKSQTIKKEMILDYDPRKRPWFINARKTWDTRHTSSGVKEFHDLISWTEPYQFYSTQKTGTTASIPYKALDGSLHVIGFDLLFDHIQAFVNEIEILDNGQVIILSTEKKPRVIALSQISMINSSKITAPLSLLEEMDQSATLIRYAVSVLENPHRLSQQPVHRFSNQKNIWWGASKIIGLESEESLFMCVIVPESDLLGDLENLRIWIILITSGVLVIGFIRAVLLAKKYGSPIESLVASIRRISKGDFESKFSVRSNIYEIKELEKAHKQMRTGLKTLMKMESDIQVARDIQQKTFPLKLPEVSGYELAAWNAPADETGGDTYDVVGYNQDSATDEITVSQDNAENAVLLLSDATGHGIGPALSVTQLRAMLRMGVHINSDIQLLINRINTQLNADLPIGRFISAWFGKIESTNNCLLSFSAGQAPLLHYTAGTKQVTVLTSDTFPLGISKKLSKTTINQIQMNPGDIFAVISDGIFEARNAKNELFGQARVIDIIEKVYNMNPIDLINRIRIEVEQFTGEHPAEDDQTILILKRLQQTD